MKYQTTSSYHCSDGRNMSPEMQKRMMEEAMRNINLNVMPKSNPLVIPFDTGIKVKQPMRQRDLSTEELLSLFDRRESLVMVYIPHFLTQCIMYYLEQMLDYARDNRIAEFKKHCRAFRMLKNDYFTALRHEMPSPVFKKFLDQREEYLIKCGPGLLTMYFTFKNELAKRHPDIENLRCPVVCYALVISSLIRHIEEFDANVNREISKRLGAPARNNGDARLTWIKGICDEIINPYPVGKTEQTTLAIKVIQNKATMMINDMVD